jgi:hypothetical protein
MRRLSSELGLKLNLQILCSELMQLSFSVCLGGGGEEEAVNSLPAAGCSLQLSP